MKEKIKELIIKGYNQNQIAEELNMNRTFIHDVLLDFFNVNDMHAARALFRKPIIEDLLKKNTQLNDIAEKLGASRGAIDKHIREYWGKSYLEVKYEFMKKYIKKLVENGLSEGKILKELSLKNDNYSSIQIIF